MEENEWLTEQFEEHRVHLRAVAYRMLGSLTEADDAVQDAWLRLSRAGADEVENLGGWLTTIVARVCLNMLRSRKMRRQDSLDVHVPDPVISPVGGLQPEDEALLADSIGLALSWCSTPWPRPRGWRSFSMTCSSCHSRRSHPWSVEPPRPPGSWPAGPDGG